MKPEIKSAGFHITPVVISTPEFGSAPVTQPFIYFIVFPGNSAILYLVKLLTPWASCGTCDSRGLCEELKSK